MGFDDALELRYPRISRNVTRVCWLSDVPGRSPCTPLTPSIMGYSGPLSRCPNISSLRSTSRPGRSGPAREGHIDKTMCNPLSAHRLVFSLKHMIHEVTRGTKDKHTKFWCMAQYLVDPVQPTRQGLVNLHMLAQLTLNFSPPTHPPKPEAAPPFPRGVRRGAPWRRMGRGPCDSRDVWSLRPLLEVTRVQRLGPREGAAGVVGCRCRCLSQRHLIIVTCSQRRSLADVGCTFLEESKSKCMMRPGAQTTLFSSCFPTVTFSPSYHKHPRPCVFSDGLFFYPLLAHGLETSIGQRG